MPQGGSFLDKLLTGLKSVEWNGTPVPIRSVVNFIGGTVADNPILMTTDVTITGSSTSGGITTVQNNGSSLPAELAINFIGFGTVADDPSHSRTNVSAPVVVTSLHTGTGISASSTVGSVTVTNTGVTSIIAGSGITASSSVGSITVGNSGVLTLTAGTNVTLGGTAQNPVINASSSGGGGGFTWPTNDIAIGNGTTTPNFQAPSATAGLPLVSLGSSSNPNYGTAVVAGGGTGLATLTAHAVMLGEGTSNVGFAAPGSVTGDVLTSNGATTDPSFQAVVNSLTGGTAISVSGSTGAVTVTNTGVTSAVAGTGIAVSGSTGAVTISTTNASLPASAFLDATTSVPDGGGVTNIGSVTITVPSGAHLAISVAFSVFSSSAGNDITTVGIGINSSSSFTESTTMAVVQPPGTSAGFAGQATVNLLSSTTGSVVVHALGDANATTYSVRALILAWVVQ